MKILYGVQATGNGHITRARVMAPALEQAGLEVDYLFSGREPDKLFNMEPFGDYRCRTGLTFAMRDGRVDLLQTLCRNRYRRLLADIRDLDLSSYDLVLCDFEPVTAWAARRQKKTSIGIAHQYAFLHALPDRHLWRLLSAQVRWFAPVKQAVGLHWHHFGTPMLPPLIQPPLFPATTEQNKILVYLPHNNLELMQQALQCYPEYQFYIYVDIAQAEDSGNLHLRPFSREDFQWDLASCSGVICNAGFGLLSEALQYGKKILCTPQPGQMEQKSNAVLLRKLGLAQVISRLDDPVIPDWLAQQSPAACRYPDVAGTLAQWLANGCHEPVQSISDRLWQQMDTQHVLSYS